MFVRKSFQFRLHPTKAQAKLLQKQLDECRWLYNELLAQRKLCHEELNVSLSKYQQLMFLPLLKKERSTLETVHSQVLQNVVDRLDKGFQAFFRRIKEGKNPGFPSFRGAHRYNSFCYPQSGFSLLDKEICFSKIGRLRIKMHRPVEGEIKTCTIKKTASGKWNITLSCEVKIVPLEPKTEAMALDVGIESFATFSNGEKIENPRFFKKGEKALAKAQRKLSKLAKGTKERRKTGRAVAKIHERIKNQRKDFCHKEAKKLIDEYQNICIEDLDIKNLIEGSSFAKNILDVSWNQFCQYLTYKAEEAGRKVGMVNPSYTSQKCSQCGHLEKKLLRERQHKCSRCGYTAHRDFNAAQNILALGLDGLGVIPRSLRL